MIANQEKDIQNQNFVFHFQLIGLSMMSLTFINQTIISNYSKNKKREIFNCDCSE